MTPRERITSFVMAELGRRHPRQLVAFEVDDNGEHQLLLDDLVALLAQIDYDANRIASLRSGDGVRS